MDKSKEMAALRRCNLSAWMHKYKKTQTDVALAADLSRSYVSLLFKPERFFGEKIARKLEQTMGMPTGYLDDDQSQPHAVESWIRPSDLQPGIYALVPRVMLALSEGELIGREQGLPPLAFRSDWLAAKSVTTKGNLRMLDVSDDAMMPYICHGDLVMIDLGQTELKDNGVYAIAYGNDLRIRRLSQRFDGGLKVMSDNANFHDEDLTPEQSSYIRVVGRAIWRAG